MPTPPAGHPERPAGEHGRALLERMNGGRHEELAEWGLAHLQIAPDARVLDIGCGGGANLARLLERAPQGHVSGIDYSPLSVQVSREVNAEAIAQGRCDVTEGDSAALPYKSASFDVVTAFETTYYWDLPAAFAQVARALTPGGRFLVCNEDNGRSPERLALGEGIPGLVMHTSDALVDALRKAGLEVEQVDDDPEDDQLAIVARKPA